MVTHTVVVELSFACAPAKAREVLERWWRVKDDRKRYMRTYRSGSMKSKAAAQRGTGA